MCLFSASIAVRELRDFLYELVNSSTIGDGHVLFLCLVPFPLRCMHVEAEERTRIIVGDREVRLRDISNAEVHNLRSGHAAREKDTHSDSQ
jgi:hypothetical protein